MRKTVNNVSIKGYVFSHHLTERVTGATSRNPGQEFINGSMEIAIDEQAMTTVRVNFSYVTPKFRNGNDNQTYQLLKRIITSNDTYEHVGNRAIRVRIDAQFEPNVFKNKLTGEIVCNTQIGASFVHELNPGEQFGMNPAKFNVDMVIGTANEREFANGGSIFELRGYVFNWKQDAVPVTFTVSDSDGRKYFENQEYPMFTNLWGDIESEMLVSQKESAASAFGAPQVQTTVRQVMRWNVKGCLPEPYEFDDENSITKKELHDKIMAHEAYIAQQTERINNRQSAPAVYNAPKQAPAAKAPSVDDFDF
jgi:hypothetical protein